MTTLLTIFHRFPTTFLRFRKIFPNLSEGHTNVSEHSPNIFRRLPKVAEEEPIMFRSYSKTSGYFLRDYVAKAMVIMLSSRLKIYNVIYRARSVRMGKNCARSLEYGPRPKVEGRTQDQGHSFFPYGPT